MPRQHFNRRKHLQFIATPKGMKAAISVAFKATGQVSGSKLPLSKRMHA